MNKILVTISALFIPFVWYTSDQTFQSMINWALKYSQTWETVQSPIMINYTNTPYYFVPLVVDNKISNKFPGLVLNRYWNIESSSTPISMVLKYPALVESFAANIYSFDRLIDVFGDTLDKTCDNVYSQESQLDKLANEGFSGITIPAVAKILLSTSRDDNYWKEFVDLLTGSNLEIIVNSLQIVDSQNIKAHILFASKSMVKASSNCHDALQHWKNFKSKSSTISSDTIDLFFDNIIRAYNYQLESLSRLNKVFDVLGQYSQIRDWIWSEKFDRWISQLKSVLVGIWLKSKYWTNKQKNLWQHIWNWITEQKSRVGVGPNLRIDLKCLNLVVGSWNYCSPWCPCDKWEGDCDTNDDCKVWLKCSKDTGSKYSFSSNVDTCEEPIKK